MMTTSFYSMFFLALLDSLNPATIATMVILLPLVRKKWYAFVFVAGTFIVYFSAGVLVYFGISLYLKEIWISFTQNYSHFINIFEIIFGTIFVIFGMIRATKLIKQLIGRNLIIKDYMGMAVKKTTPLAIVILSIGSTCADLPTAIPYFGFTGLLSASDINIGVIIVLFAIYCAIYTAPMIVLYFVYAFIKGEKLHKFEQGIMHFMNAATVYSIPLILLLGGGFLLLDGIN